jgi:hypothetical protein
MWWQKEEKEKKKEVIFCVLCLFIGLVSSLDTSLIVWAGDCLREENALCQFLINHFGVSSFVGIKMFATIFLLGVLLFLYRCWNVGAWIVCVVISLIQLMLLLYLFTN